MDDQRVQRSQRLELEPSAVFPSLENGCDGPMESEIEHSKAISLKRIADAVAGVDASNLQSIVERFAWEAGRNFQAGLRTDR